MYSSASPITRSTLSRSCCHGTSPPRSNLTQHSPRKTERARASSPWPNVEAFLDYDGHISIGHIEPIGYAAIANDDHNMLAALVRRPGETFTQLLDRLDRAIELAVNEETITDEING
jgi:hypothetical protein